MKIAVFRLLLLAMSDDTTVSRSAKYTVVKNLELKPDCHGDYIPAFIAYIENEGGYTTEQAKDMIRDDSDLMGLAMILVS